MIASQLLKEIGRSLEMRINIIGGGPAGLYFAILMKKADPKHQITIYERNGPDDTFGWGVVFSGKTLANLRAADEESHAAITNQFEAWDNVDVVHRDDKISIHGNSFSGIVSPSTPQDLAASSQATRRRSRLKMKSPTSRRFAVSDLLIAADGVNSGVRSRYAAQLQPALMCAHRYIWYGTNQLFHGLTLTFREMKTGVRGPLLQVQQNDEHVHRGVRSGDFEARQPRSEVR